MARFTGSSSGGAGLPGPQGPQGLPGEQGPAGNDGLSAYQVAVSNGFSGTEQEWLASLEASVDLTGYATENYVDTEIANFATKTIIEKTSSFTISPEDANSIVEINANAPITITVPSDDNADIPVGSEIKLVQMSEFYSDIQQEIQEDFSNRFFAFWAAQGFSSSGISASLNDNEVTGEPLFTNASSSLPSAVTAGVWSSYAYNDEVIIVAQSNEIVLPNNNQSDTYVYSTDGGVTWELGTFPSAGYWHVAYGGGKFVALANNTALSSTDGINWTSSGLPTDALWSGIAYGFDMFVAVSLNGSFVVSSDGSSWSTRPSPLPLEDFSAIAFGGDRFVIASRDGSVLQATNSALSWQPIDVSEAGNGLRWDSIAFGNDRFVITNSEIGNGYIIAISGDGQYLGSDNNEWLSDFKSVAFANDTFLIATSEARYGLSSDGLTWIDSRAFGLGFDFAGEPLVVGINHRTVTDLSTLNASSQTSTRLSGGAVTLYKSGTDKWTLTN